MAQFDLSIICMRARKFLSQGRINDALDLYSDVLTIDPTNALALADRGTALAMSDNFEAALADLARAIELGYRESATYRTVATIHFELRNYSEAVAFFAKALEADPVDALALYNRARTFQEMGKIDSAFADFSKCLALSTDDAFLKLVRQHLEELRR